MQTSLNSCNPINKCLCCESAVVTILDLGYQPPANSYLKSPTDNEEVFPLRLNYCNQCTHLQLSHAVDPNILFKHYLYVSGTTQTLKQYFHDFVYLVSRYIDKKQLKILDIACNDGSQLDAFKNANHITYGIDPAQNLYEISRNNHNIICDYLSYESISGFNTTFDVIIAQNVFAHNAYPFEFLNICKKYLSDNGRIFIQTSQADMVKYGQFDTIYHEHISFFNSYSMQNLVDRCGLYLNDILKTKIHGNSYVFVISKDNIQHSYHEDRLTDYDINYFIQNVSSTIIDVKNQINNFKIKNNDSIIVGYGAAAKGNTVLNYGNIKLDYIVDDNPLKQGLYTPGMKIPIVSLDYINQLNKKIAWIPLSWNFFDEIKQKITDTRHGHTDSFLKFKFSNI